MSDNDDIEVDSDEESPRFHSVVRSKRGSYSTFSL